MWQKSVWVGGSSLQVGNPSGKGVDDHVQGRLFRRQPLLHVDQPRTLEGADPPGPRGSRVHRDPHRGSAAVQPGLRRGFPARSKGAEGGDRWIRRHSVRHPGVQPLHPRSAEECHRLGIAAVGSEFLRADAGRRDRGICRAARNSDGAAEPAGRAQLLQCPADDGTRGLHPILPGDLPGRGRGRRRVHQDLPCQLHESVPDLRHSGPHRHTSHVSSASLHDSCATLGHRS